MFATWRKGKGDLSDVYRCYSCSTSWQWIRRRQENGYFTNIVRELAAEDIEGDFNVEFWKAMLIKLTDF